ncbi:MAG TPA: hypothetical protein VIV64_00655 [Gammaproteobacteria bacterium]
MPRSTILLALGALVGGLIAFAYLDSADRAAAPDPAGQSLLDTMPDSAAGEPRISTVSVAGTLAAYLEAAAETDVSDLASLLDEFAALPWSPARDVEIDALLTRLSDLEPAYAATLSSELRLDVPFVADAYLNWALSDPGAAIDGLSQIGDRTERLEVALALLDVLGDDNVGLGRVAAGLPAQEASLLAVEAIVARAGYEPFAAFRAAVALNQTNLQQTALSEIGRVWAAQDPRGAIAQAELLPEALKGSFRSGVFGEWARLDGGDFVAWLASQSAPPTEAILGVDLLGGVHLDALTGIAEAMTGDEGRQVRAAAYAALAEIDPDAAMTRAAELPPGEERDLVLMNVASTVARGDPDAALRWASQITPPSRNLMNQITIALIQNDPVGAIGLMENPPRGVDPALVTAVIASSIGQDPENAEVFANRLLAGDSIQATNALRNIVSGWMRQDPERALEWVLANDAALDSAIIGPAAQALARADPVAAAGYVLRIPDAYRSAWVTQVAGPFGQRDPNGAFAWVAQFRGQDFYAGALRQVVSAASVAQWAADDPGAARNFVVGLDRGETRDQALTALIPVLAGNDRAQAEDLLDLVTSANTRRSIEERIAAFQ